ncbi:MAG: hypothetical protein ABI337_01610 [Nitrososphaera sp.]|jgi:hypothetical protein
MVETGGIFGIILSFALIFVALLIFDAFDTNVVNCNHFTNNTKTACENTKTYVGIAFIILPITILFDVIGLLPIFGGRFVIR